MHVFVTGASGFIGSNVTKELISKGHTVLGLARSEASAVKIKAMGAEVLMGDVTKPEILAQGAKQTDATIHLAYIHDFSSLEAFETSAQRDKEAVDAMIEVLAGTGKPMSIASGILGFQGYVDEDTPFDGPMTRTQNGAHYMKEFKEKNIKGSVVRLPPTVHAYNDKGFVKVFCQTFKALGKVLFVGDGTNHWAACHVTDVAKVFVLAIEKTTTPAIYHAFEELITMNEILGLISKTLDITIEHVDPETGAQSLQFLAMVMPMNVDSSSEKTQKALGWSATGPKLLEDMKEHYFKDL